MWTCHHRHHRSPCHHRKEASRGRATCVSAVSASPRFCARSAATPARVGARVGTHAGRLRQRFPPYPCPRARSAAERGDAAREPARAPACGRGVGHQDDHRHGHQRQRERRASRDGPARRRRAVFVPSPRAGRVRRARAPSSASSASPRGSPSRCFRMRRCSRVTPSLNASFARRSLRKSACSVLAVRASASTATATSVPPYEGASPPMHPASNPRRGPRPPRPVCAENDGERRVRRRVERRIRAKAVAIRGGVVSSEAIPAKNERAATQRGGPGIGSSASVSTASGPGWSRASGAPRTVGHGVGVQARLRCATTQRERLF